MRFFTTNSLRIITISLTIYELMNSGTKQNDAQNLHSLRFVCKKHRIRKKICCLGICSQENLIKAHISLLTRLFIRHSSQMTNQAQQLNCCISRCKLCIVTQTLHIRSFYSQPWYTIMIYDEFPS